MERTTDPDSFLPLRPAVFHILLALGEKQLHGYAIGKAVRSQTSSRISLSAGPMYRHLKRLLDARLIEETTDRPELENEDERRRYYRITDLGREVLGREAARMAELAKAVFAVQLGKA